MDSNELTGPIPPTIGRLQELEQLYLEHNRLEGPIPDDLCHLTNLGDLYVSNNKLYGLIPTCLGKLKSLRRLYLDYNNLTSIPSNLWSLHDLLGLNLSTNSLGGNLPLDIGNLKVITQLDLSWNQLSGDIPSTIGSAQSLVNLSLGHNKLQGHIPQSLGIFGSIWRKKDNSRLPTQVDSVPLAWRRISYHQLLQATNAFNESNLLGKGSFGSVYGGTLSDGTNIAVKVFNLQSGGAFRSFDVECEVMRNIRHRNLTEIISSCTNMDFKALLLEYRPNGSLEKWLYSHNYCLDVLQWLNIMIDVASALEYLHHGHTTPILHCDLKPSNVLLDENMVAHIADFGIAKLLGDGDFMAQTRTCPTIGYTAP
ncbi:receptor kinase-like protein Xa21 [Cornus florida]|uniref:receptor kinase-like protein Xa21 n=1 Tax=Cornus florida TaxID=4283 RepID=UPI00289CC014|nr:receptor kinase-like protein Xa21 [Cornus florida]